MLPPRAKLRALVCNASSTLGLCTRDGERYELHLCEDCFFQTVAYLKQERRTHNLFNEGNHTDTVGDSLDLVIKDEYFGDSGK